jgi:hypothetical protein
VGYQYTTLYEIGTLSGFTNTSEGMAGGSIAHLWGNGAAGGTRANAIKYISPKLAGAWTVAVELGSAGGRENTEFGSAVSANGRTLDKQARTSLHIDYNQGPLRAAIGFTQFNADTSASFANGVVPGATPTNAAGTALSNTNVSTFNVYGALTAVGGVPTTGNTTYSTNLTQLAGSYDFGAVKVGATIISGVKNTTSASQSYTAGGAALGTAGTAAATTLAGNYNFAARALSFDMPMGNVNLVGGFSNASLDGGGVALNDWSSSQLGVKYNLSKRTIVYGFTGTSTDNLATTATAFKQMTGTVVGIDHQF